MANCGPNVRRPEAVQDRVEDDASDERQTDCEVVCPEFSSIDHTKYSEHEVSESLEKCNVTWEIVDHPRKRCKQKV